MHQSDVTTSPGRYWPVIAAGVNIDHDQKYLDQKQKYIHRNIDC